MTEPMRSRSYSFAFERPLDTWARRFAVVPARSYVRVDAHGFEAVYGPWRLATTWSNVVSAECTGPYTAWKVAGPPRLSLADRGLTMAGTTAGGVCLRFRQPVPGIEPLGLIRHPGVTLGVEEPEAFRREVEARIKAVAGQNGSTSEPDHPEGGMVAAARALWHWRRRHVDHHERMVDRIEFPPLDRAGDADDQPVETGTGPAFHRRYLVRVRNGVLRPEEAMSAIQADPNVLADLTLAPFTKVRGASGEMRLGDRYVVEIAGPWKGAVEVIQVTPDSFRLATLEGHMESGVIEMRAAADPDDPQLVRFTIESWARSHDRFLDVMYDKLGVAKALQSEMWSIACDRFAAVVHGHQVGPLDIDTERAREVVPHRTLTGVARAKRPDRAGSSVPNDG